MAMDSEICKRASESLKAKQILVPDEWIVQCVAFVKEDLSENGLPCTSDNICERVYNQWTLSDLRELQEPVFPKHVSTARRVILNGVYCVQVNSAIDISVSAYSQYQKVAAVGGDNTEVDAEAEEQVKPWEPKATRMLTLELTDGLVTVKGIEDRSIPDLRPDLLPGFKVRLQGRIECRKGILFLGPENVDVLGGNVESLVEANGFGRALKQRLIAISNDDSRHSDEVIVTTLPSAAEDEPRSTSLAAVPHHGSDVLRIDDDDDSLNDVLATVPLSVRNGVRHDYDDHEALPSAAEDKPQRTSLAAVPVQNTSMFHVDYDDDQAFPSTAEDKPLISSLVTVPLHGSNVLHVAYDEDRGISMKVAESYRPFWAQSTSLSMAYPYPPVFSTLKDKLANMRLAAGPTVCTVRAQILGIGQKLSVNHGSRWTIGVIIHDGTTSAECDIEDALVARLLQGFTAQQAWNAKKKNPPDVNELVAIETAMEQMYDFLSRFGGLIQLEFYPTPRDAPGPTQRPLIKSFRHFNEGDLNRLRSQAMKMTTSAL